MVKLKYQDVFVPGGFPRHTYNPREGLQLEQRLSEAKANLCKLVTVTGQTKSGKTVLAKRVFPSEDTIWIDGGTVSAEEDFWQVAIEALGIFQTTSEQSSDATSSKVGAKGTAGANFLIAKGSAELAAEIGSSRTSALASGRTLSSRVAAISALKSNRVPVIVDDFHYIPVKCREISSGRSSH